MPKVLQHEYSEAWIRVYSATQEAALSLYELCGLVVWRSQGCMKLGQRLSHEVYGLGTVIHFEDSPKVDINSESKNGVSRYSGSINIAVKFDTGGPLGWAVNSSNNVRELKEC